MRGETRMKVVGWLVIGVGVVGCAAVESLAHAEGLSGLDAKLSGTGRIGTFTPESRIAPAATNVAGAAGARDPAAATVRIDDDAATRGAPQPSGLRDDEVRLTEAPVAACRLEVARRRRVPPAKIAAGTVTLRFTIERTGRVRDAEALTAVDTDLEVAACAKRVVSEWTFAPRSYEAVVVERPYRFSETQLAGHGRAMRTN